ncbi:MAG TPA: ShlB/FhaC/HecB family hemolysin secretion/activation protein [Gammaproteobacteria bacterium]|nr:ShlB/FhaC/HecB family hemolysin secretion/activation protein [Gammaproteobacteria bacterium]
MKGGFLYNAAVSGATVFFSASLAAAPVPAIPPPPPPVTPGQVQSTLPTQTQTPKNVLTPSSSAPTNASGVAPGGPAFKVNSFSIEGNSVIPTDELQAQIASYVGQTLTLAQLYDVADVLTRYYRSKGYGLAYVAPPAQKLSGGNVRLQVVEGRIGDVNVQGNSRTRSAVFRARAAGLHSGEVYTDAAAERAVMLMNDLPGVSAHEVLSPGTQFGNSDILFNVDETGYSADASVDDYGRSVIGRWRLNADAAINSLTGSGDQLAAGITHSQGNELNFGKLSYALPVSPAGSMLTTSFNRAEYHGLFSSAPGSPAEGFSGSTQNAAINWQDPVVRTTAKSVFWSAGLSYDNSRSETAATNSLTTNILLLQINRYYTRTWADQSTFSMSTTLWTNGKHYDHSQGLNNVNAERGRFEADLGYQMPFGGWNWVNQFNAAYSVNTLTDADKFNLGGPGSVLGYQSAEERGDSGYFASTEIERGLSLGKYLPIVWGLFLDTGKVWDKAGTLTTGGDNVRGISSAGLDLQLLPTSDRLNARLQWAYSIGRRPADGDGGGHIWFTLGMTF